MVRQAKQHEPLYKVTYESHASNIDLRLAKNNLEIICDDSYQTWDEFRLEILSAKRPLSVILEPDHPINRVRLRYVDAFKDDMLGKKSPIAFLEEDLGISTNLPQQATNDFGQTSEKPGF
ncbi:hypothetical protein CRD60_08005 [Bifidobacterium aemilianum]|uniref:Uncharacterized protein n=1 Tax=Bifidobacterium aemilianum TaxID=2493120 RepID=A0A366K7W1_9BIFI|nr:TIGR04255 family protein [Bifidobacterium aemilianum]RBP97203.1 hypothetical protein CRD60_08005 [Bifidobacterium aemilianum]